MADYGTTAAVRPVSYSALAAKILEETLVLPKIGSREFMNPTDSFKVWVAGDESMGNYSPGTLATASDPSGAFVTINNPKDKYIYKMIDKNQLRKVYNPVDYVDQAAMKAIQAASVQVDKDVLQALVDNGTSNYTQTGDAVAAGSLVEGTLYQVTVANSAGDATDVGCAAATAVVGEVFVCLADDGTSETALAVKAVTPVSATIKSQIIALEKALNLAKAPIEGRFLIVSPEVASLFEGTLVLNTSFGDVIQSNGFKSIGSAYGFNILMSLYLPATANIIAVHADAFGGNFEEIEPIELIEVPRGHGTIGAWSIDGRIAYNYGVLRPTLIQVA